MNKFLKGCGITAAVFIGIGIVIGVVVSIIGGRSFWRIAGERSISITPRFFFDSAEGWTIGGKDFGDWDFSWDNDWDFSWDNDWDFSLDNGWNWDWSNDNDWESVGDDWDQATQDHDGDDGLNNSDFIASNRYEESISGDDIDELNIMVAACRFTVLEWDQEDYKIELAGNVKCDHYTDDNTLYIRGSSKVEINTVFDPANEIVLYVPEGVTYDKVDLELGGGEMEMDGIETHELNGSVGLGNANLINSTADELDIENGLGDFYFSGRVNDEISAECSMGNITLRLDGGEKDFDYSINCTAGSISIDGNDYSALAGNRVINNHADGEMDLECGMGSIEVMFDR
ncbi:MAG: DUF4097 family beta strand repeat-containing protein [Lachnospiraceae bacterium]|jgi:hypothetical protein|nr:DUF4097 family beta strand repeat-containing protein [Lachnospiraceae bacterium]